MAEADRLIMHETDADGVCLVQLNHPKSQNPFSRQMTQRLIALAPAIERDPAVRAVVITGGVGRSFSVGGDFNDVRPLKTPAEVTEYLGEIVDLYVAVLAISKPVVAAVDHFAIGQGLQVALQADWRVATARASLSMPELRNGVACPLGSVILEALLGRARMLRLVVGCESFDASQALALALLDEVVEPGDLIASARRRAAQFAAYPATPFRATKRLYNARMIAQLEAGRAGALEAHALSCLERPADPHFDRILGGPAGKP